MKLIFCGTVAICLGCLCGCAALPASNSGCTETYVLTVSPNVATTSHSAPFPTNQVQFTGLVRPTAPQGCPVPTYVLQDYASWSNPDPIDIQISSANDATNGTAVCKGPTNGAVTLTGTFAAVLGGTSGNGIPQTTETVQLTCQ